MISSSSLAPSQALDLKSTRSLQNSKVPNLEFGQATKQQQSLLHSHTENSAEQQVLHEHLAQVIEQHINQVTDNPSEIHLYKPLAINTPKAETETDSLIELIDLESLGETNLHQTKPLALGQQTGNARSELHHYKPLALNEKSSSLDIQLLTENSTALLIDPQEQFLKILQTLLKNTQQEPPLYRLENPPPSNATQVATDVSQPNLAWQASLWF